MTTEISRDKRPKPGMGIKFSPPLFKKYLLKNNSEIYLIKKSDLPIVKINFIIHSGSRFDPEYKYGLSNLTAMCIDEGAGELDALQLSDEFDYLGARFSIHSDSDSTILSLQTLSENFETALNLLSTVIQSPHFNEIDFQREKRKVQTRIEQLKDEPDYIADSSFEYFLFGNKNPYAFPVIGTKDTIKQIEVSDVIEFYKKFFNPYNMSIVAVGSFDEQILISQLENTFHNWTTGESFSAEIFTGEKYNNKIYLLNKPESVQTEIRIGHPSEKRNDKDYLQKQVLNLILGGQFSSRLNSNLREKRGFTYGINSRFNYQKEAAYFVVATSVNTENSAVATIEILNELKKIRKGVSQDELEFAKSSIYRRFPLNFETYSQIASNFGNKIIHKLPDDYFATILERISEVNIDEVNLVATKSIVPGSASIVLCGDVKELKKQVQKMNFGEVVQIDFEEIYSYMGS